MCKKLDDSNRSELGDSSSTISLTDPTVCSSSPASITVEPVSAWVVAGIIKKSVAPATETGPAMKKTVTFQNVEIARYPMILGDNPSADCLPLSIGWECDTKLVFQLEEYETLKPEPRTRHEFWMPPNYREQFLKSQGVSMSEMLRTTTEIKRIRNSRYRSIRNQKWDKLSLLIEESGRKLKKVTSTTSLKRASSSSKLNQFKEDSWRKLKKIGSATSLNKSPSSSSLLSNKFEGFSSSVSANRKRKPRSTSMSMVRSTSMSMLTPQWGGFTMRDNLDTSISRQRIAMHLLRNPEDLMVDRDESRAEDDPTPSSPRSPLSSKLLVKSSSMPMLCESLDDDCKSPSLNGEDDSETPTAELSDNYLDAVNIVGVEDEDVYNLLEHAGDDNLLLDDDDSNIWF